MQEQRTIPRVCAHCGAAFLARKSRQTRFCSYACSTVGRVAPAIARFWPKVRVDEETGCWLWVGGLTPQGYGLFFLSKQGEHEKISAHRWCYEFFIGPIPEGLQLDHLCRNRACVCPWHVEPVTCWENLHRGDTSKWGAHLRAKTHCPKGHPYDAENTLIKHGGRHCRECGRQYSRVRLARLRALAVAAGLPPQAANQPAIRRVLLAQAAASLLGQSA